MISETMRNDFASAIPFCKRALVILPTFPFFFVGKVKRTTSSYVTIKAEFGVPQELKGLDFRIRFDAIRAYFVETNTHKIPDCYHEEDNHKCE